MKKEKRWVFFLIGCGVSLFTAEPANKKVVDITQIAPGEEGMSFREKIVFFPKGFEMPFTLEGEGDIFNIEERDGKPVVVFNCDFYLDLYGEICSLDGDQFLPLGEQLTGSINAEIRIDEESPKGILKFITNRRGRKEEE